ncbi:hypothetical protein Golax_011513 [Gossypium laxum]|uniref:Uncharacterized protein n=1 Tax=Gossypium laxum TaxID=34288 RepID=A0A7J8ZM71_9ROSI|nr:hypothetical protein [Gossypium laxum]
MKGFAVGLMMTPEYYG